MIKKVDFMFTCYTGMNLIRLRNSIVTCDVVFVNGWKLSNASLHEENRRKQKEIKTVNDRNENKT